MSKKNVLGRGLNALIEDYNMPKHIAPQTVPMKDSFDIPIGEIEANPFQPRTHFDEVALNELSESILQVGIIQPLTVRKISDKHYQLIAGERRLRAAKLAGLERVPAYVRTADDNNLLEMALIENIQREDLDSIEIALSYQRLMDECNLTQESLSERVGKKRSTIANYLRLLKLPAEIQLGIREKKLTMGHARALVNIDDQQQLLDVYNDIIENELSVRQVEELVRNLGDTEEVVEGKLEKAPKKAQTAEVEKLKEQLAGYFSSKVDFKRNPNGAGKIIISFGNDTELEQIISRLDRLNS